VIALKLYQGATAIFSECRESERPRKLEWFFSGSEAKIARNRGDAAIPCKSFIP
jgi:hypothetical protein